MNSSVKRFSLSLHSAQSQVSIPVMLGDTGRTWRITLSDDSGNLYTIADGCLAKLSIKRPTGTNIEEFCNIEGNTTIVYHFDQNENTAAVEGIHECDITLYGLDGRKLGTARFTMVVSEQVVSSDDIFISDEERTTIDSIIAEEAIRQQSERARLTAEAERVAAETERVQSEEARKTACEKALSDVDEAVLKAIETMANKIDLIQVFRSTLYIGRGNVLNGVLSI